MAVPVLDMSLRVSGSAAEPTPTGSERWMGCNNRDLGVPFLAGKWGSIQGVSRVFGMPRSTVHHTVHWVNAEVVAIRHKVIYLPKTTEYLVPVTCGIAGLARHRAAMSDSSHQAALMVTAKQETVLLHHPAGSLWPSGPLCRHVRGLAGVGARLPSTPAQPTVQACYLPSSRVGVDVHTHLNSHNKI